MAQPNGTLESPWLTQQEAAKYLKVHPETIRRAAVAGRLKRYGVGQSQRYRRADLDEFQYRRQAE